MMSSSLSNISYVIQFILTVGAIDNEVCHKLIEITTPRIQGSHQSCEDITQLYIFTTL